MAGGPAHDAPKADTAKASPTHREAPADEPPRPEPANLLWSRIALRPPASATGSGAPPPIQPKLTVGAPDDVFEQEADAVADRVMRMPSPDGGPLPVSSAPGQIRRKCAACEEEERAEDIAPPSATVRRKPTGPGTADAPRGAARHVEALKGGGEPLPLASRGFFEPRFGHDFSDVRVHSGPRAGPATRQLSARAFTLGTDIAFAPGEFAPETSRGRRLLAHELTHVVQQRSRPPRVQRNGDEDRSSETKDQFATRVHERAASRLTRNIAVLGQWADYVRAMQAFQLRAQLMTGMLVEFATVAAPSPTGRGRFEDTVSTRNAAEREFKGSMLDIQAEYRDRSDAFMGFLGSKTQGHWTTPSIAENLQVVAGDRPEGSLPPSVYVPPDPRYSEYEAPIRRFKSGESGGCQTCHDINLAYQRTTDRWGTALPRGDFLEFATLDRSSLMPGEPTWDAALGGDDAELGDWMDLLREADEQQSPAPGIATQSAGVSQATQPAAANPFVPAVAPPEAVETPPPRTDLCGELPDAEDSARQPDLASWGPGAAVVADIVARIDAVLTPLGPRGYRVLKRRSFDSLYAMTPDGMERVRDDIIAQIDERKGNYADLRAEIQAGDVPYEELCPIVDELLPSTNAYVQFLALQDVQAWQRREAILTALELILTALTFIYPPAAIVTIPAMMALGLARASLGVDQMRQGRQWTKGTGAGLYSLSQEAQAPGLESHGRTNIIFGLLEFGLSGLTALKMIREARATARLLDSLEAGAIITHQNFPGLTLYARRGQLLMVNEHFEVVGYGAIRDGRIWWTSLEVPYSPFAGAGLSGGPGATGTSIVPYGSNAIVPYGYGTGTPMNFGPLPGPTAMTPSGGRPLMLGPGWQPAGLLGPGVRRPALIPTEAEMVAYEAVGTRLDEIIRTGGPIVPETRGYGTLIVDVPGYTGPRELRISAAPTDAFVEGAPVAHAVSPPVRTLPAARSWTVSPGGGIQHINDVEVKLLEHIRPLLPPDATGTIHILNLRGSGGAILNDPFPHCPSCTSAIQTFSHDFPGIRIVSHAATPTAPRIGGMRLRLPDQ